MGALRDRFGRAEFVEARLPVRQFFTFRRPNYQPSGAFASSDDDGRLPSLVEGLMDDSLSGVDVRPVWSSDGGAVWMFNEDSTRSVKVPRGVAYIRCGPAEEPMGWKAELFRMFMRSQPPSVRWVVSVSGPGMIEACVDTPSYFATQAQAEAYAESVERRLRAMTHE